MPHAAREIDDHRCRVDDATRAIFSLRLRAIISFRLRHAVCQRVDMPYCFAAMPLRYITRAVQRRALLPARLRADALFTRYADAAARDAMPLRFAARHY